MSQAAKTLATPTKFVGIPPYTNAKDRVVIGCQKLADVLDEVAPLHAAHYQEIETNYLDQPFDPGYDRYIQQEEAGQFVLFTVHEGSTMTGYLQYYVFRDMHAQGMLTAREDAFYLSPGSRGKGLGPKLLGYAEHFLKKLGCKYAGMTDKSPVGGTPIAGFLQKHGYKTVATYLVKEL